MADPMEEAKHEAEADAADERLNRFMESLGGTASARAVFGEPVEKDGVTIVPVARVRYGGGGGGGRGPGRKKKGDAQATRTRSGFGHGGGVQAAPVGYIELSGGQASLQAHRRPGSAPWLSPCSSRSWGRSRSPSWRSRRGSSRGAEVAAPAALVSALRGVPHQKSGSGKVAWRPSVNALMPSTLVGTDHRAPVLVHHDRHGLFHGLPCPHWTARLTDCTAVGELSAILPAMLSAASIKSARG